MKKVMVSVLMLWSILSYAQEYAQFRLVPKGVSGRYKVYFFENDKGYYIQDTLKKSDLEVGLINTALNYISPNWEYVTDNVDGDIRWHIVRRKKTKLN
jgi:hypothetical protein